MRLIRNAFLLLSLVTPILIMVSAPAMAALPAQQAYYQKQVTAAQAQEAKAASALAKALSAQSAATTAAQKAAAAAAVSRATALLNYWTAVANAWTQRANIPAPQHANLFTPYNARPPWTVAGVDYYVGMPNGTPGKDPSNSANMPVGASVDSTNHLIRVAGNNVTLDGFDFSKGGVYSVYVTGATGTRVTNSYFYGGVPVHDDAASSNTTVDHCTIDGGGVNGDTGFGELLVLGPGAIVQYNWIHDAPQHFLSTGGNGPVVYKYNLLENGGWSIGAHLNYIQFGGGTITSAQVEYNTIIQHITLAGGEVIQMYTNSAGSIANSNVGFNTIVTIPQDITGNAANPNSQATSYIMHLGSNSQYPGSYTGTCHDNYIDPTSSYGAFYGGLTGFTYTNNRNLVTGTIIPGS